MEELKKSFKNHVRRVDAETIKTPKTENTSSVKEIKAVPKIHLHTGSTQKRRKANKDDLQRESDRSQKRQTQWRSQCHCDVLTWSGQHTRPWMNCKKSAKMIIGTLMRGSKFVGTMDGFHTVNNFEWEKSWWICVVRERLTIIQTTTRPNHLGVENRPTRTKKNCCLHTSRSNDLMGIVSLWTGNQKK